MQNARLLKDIFIIIYKMVFRAVYSCFGCLRKTDNQKMVMVLYRSEHLNDNLKLVYDEICKQNPDIKIHLIHSAGKMNLKLFKEAILLSNAKYLVLDDYYLPIYLLCPRKNLKVIQLWHAAGAFKKFGYSTIGTKFGPSQSYLKHIPIHSNYNYVYISAEKFTRFYAEAFNMSERFIYPLGIPRTDMLTDAEKVNVIRKKMLAKYPILDNEVYTYILMAPTYRAKGMHYESHLDMVDVMVNLSTRLDKDKYIIFKPHPYMDRELIERIRGCRHAMIADSDEINEWMIMADAFMTDYSSSIFEYALLHRPMAHFVPDMDEYKDNRGFYDKIETMSDACVIKDIEHAVLWINERSKGEIFDSKRMIDYNFDHYNNTTKGIVRHFLKSEK